MQHLRSITRVSKVKKVRRHHRSSTTKQKSKIFHSAQHQIKTPKLLNVVPVVENIVSAPSTPCLSIATEKQRSANVSVIHVSQNNSLQELITNDLPKSVIPPRTMTSFSRVHSKQTILSAKDSYLFDSKIDSTNRTDTTLSFHSRANTWCSTSKGNLFERHSRNPHYVYRVKEEKTEKRRRRRRRGGWGLCCPCCSPCCCLLTGILLALFLAGLTALIGLLITTKTKSTTSTSSSTSTTTTSVTTITTTSVTTSSTSSTSTSSTSSSSSSSTSTSSTSTSSTSSTSTSSTSTSTTSITTITVTTVTTTTTAATVTITSNTCTSGWKGVTVLYHCDNCPNISPYTQYTYTYTAISNRTRIAFSFREDTGCFALDNVSVRSATAPTIELIANNGFETGTLSSWTYCNPQSASSAGQVKKNSDSFLCMGYIYQAKSGTHFYYDGAVGNCDYLIQQFATDIGSTYTISYWLYNRGTGSASSADVIISI